MLQCLNSVNPQHTSQNLTDRNFKKHRKMEKEEKQYAKKRPEKKTKRKGKIEKKNFRKNPTQDNSR